MRKQAERGAEAFERLINELAGRQATGRAVLKLELDEALLASLLESGATMQDEAQVSGVQLQLFQDAAVFSCRVRVKGKAFPPRPPVDTGVELAVRDITASEAGESGSILFRVEKPLTFSSTFADLMMGLIGKLAKNLPVSIDALRHKDALVTLDFARFVAAFQPELASRVRHVRLHGVQVSNGKAEVEVGFVR